MIDHCSQPSRSGVVPLASLQPDAVDHAFLRVARAFFVSFSDQDPNALIMPMLAADALFPGENSAESMRRALAVIHEMRCSRRTCFQFSNPRCPKCSELVTATERHLLQLIQYARAARVSKVMSSAMLLCEGNPIDRVVSAAYSFADSTEGRKTQLSRVH